jgi:protein involved in polysaccharide export with SLBB domain
MKKIRILFIMVLFSTLGFSVDVLLDQNSSDKSKLSIGSKVYFGENAFKGNFKENRQFRYNPDYLINVGDVISVKMWGAYEFTSDLTVDKQGNIFLPKVGAISILGLPTGQLKEKIEHAIKKVFNDNVSVYADIQQYQPISIFVSGAVNKVGLYDGLSTDSILQFIDKADGIIRGQGSFRDISILRNKKIIKNIDLYKFLIDGQVDAFQFQNGDVILVNSVQNFIEVEGDVNRPYTFELLGNAVTVKDIMEYIMPKPTANSFMLSSWKNMQESTKKYALDQASQVYVKNGEKLKFYSNYYINSVGIHIEGEHIGDNDITVQKGTTLYDVLNKITFTPLSEIKNIRLYRTSVANTQKQLIETMLKDLEARAFSSDSSTVEEANIRNKESEMVLKFIERAKSIEPLGQIVLSKEDNLAQIYLEEGDKIVIPKWSNVVVVQGEVNIPNALTYKENYSIDKYIEVCGGYSERANRDKILLIKANGQVIQHSSEAFFANNSSEKVEAGDSILVLGEVDSKNILITSSVTQIIYQLAVGAAVVLRAF